MPDVLATLFGSGEKARVMRFFILNPGKAFLLTEVRDKTRLATPDVRKSITLLTKVDLPLAAPSILAGVNQTIMLSLAMVVVASLIGAKGLGEDVLEALQYSSVGQGILAGFAILFCAMILNRVVQGQRD